MELAQRPGFVQRNEHFDQELLMLGLEGQSEAVDDAAEDFQQLTDPIKVFGFVDEPSSGK